MRTHVYVTVKKDNYLHRFWVETLDILGHLFDCFSCIHNIFNNNNRIIVDLIQIRFRDINYV